MAASYWPPTIQCLIDFKHLISLPEKCTLCGLVVIVKFKQLKQMSNSLFNINIFNNSYFTFYQVKKTLV